jgi:hypothetical protein
MRAQNSSLVLMLLTETCICVSTCLSVCVSVCVSVCLCKGVLMALAVMRDPTPMMLDVQQELFLSSLQIFVPQPSETLRASVTKFVDANLTAIASLKTCKVRSRVGGPVLQQLTRLLAGPRVCAENRRCCN